MSCFLRPEIVEKIRQSAKKIALRMSITRKNLLSRNLIGSFMFFLHQMFCKFSVADMAWIIYNYIMGQEEWASVLEKLMRRQW